MRACDLESTAGYVASKRGSDGGYLSYQYMDMFESAADDTFYALATLRLLGREAPGVEATEAFLKGLQLPGGGYRSLLVAYYAVKALSLLGARLRDPRGARSYILEVAGGIASGGEARGFIAEDEHFLEDGSLKSFDEAQLISGGEVPSPLLAASLGLEALSLLGGPPEGFAELVGGVVEGYVERWRGSAEPTLDSVFHALRVYRLLGREPPRELGRYVEGCESEEGGFTVRPGVETRFLEHTYYGLRSLSLLGLEPRRPRRHVEHICSCQNGDGGFRRSPMLGLSTLENTFYAVAALVMLGEAGGGEGLEGVL